MTRGQPVWMQAIGKDLHLFSAMVCRRLMDTLEKNGISDCTMAAASQVNLSIGNVANAESKGGPMLDPQQMLASALGGCARGDKAALRLIFDSEGTRLMAIAQRILRRHDLAEEIVQDAFVQIWRKASSYSPDRGSARGWIYAIVRNRALNALRDGKRWELSDGETLERLQDAAQDTLPTDLFEELDRESNLRKCLDQLDEKKRISILMAYVSGYTHGEIAGRLKVPLGTAKAWIKRGLSSLRECMS
jgi:RNA polymerase sigma-70 factor, ECF subfamily